MALRAEVVPEKGICRGPVHHPHTRWLSRDTKAVGSVENRTRLETWTLAANGLWWLSVFTLP